MPFNIIAGPTTAVAAGDAIDAASERWIELRAATLWNQHPDNWPDSDREPTGDERAAADADVAQFQREQEMIRGDLQAAAVLCVKELRGEIYVQVAGHGDPDNPENELLSISVRGNPSAIESLAGELADLAT